MGLLSRRLGNAAAARTTELHQQSQKQQHRNNSAVLGGAIAGGAAAALILVALVLLILHRRLKRASKTSPSDVAAPRLRRFSYRELKAATGGFGEAHKLGQGGFGSVFKGTLRGGQQVAVKRLDTASLQGEREFVNEVSVMGSMGVSSASIIGGGGGGGGGGGSPHVVGLLGFCADSKRKLLVYEYMENRSLQEALFDESYPVALEWEKRMKIVLDIARALAFLHLKCEPPIIHGDVKPSNVLLDAGFSARLADFGLARVKTEGSVDKDVRSEEVERDSMERERIRSQRVARDRERKRKDKERRRQEAEATAAALEQRGVAAAMAGGADENCNKVFSSSSPEVTDAAAAADHGAFGFAPAKASVAEDGAFASAAVAGEEVSGAADESQVDFASAAAADRQAQDQNRIIAADAAAQEVGDSSTDENRGAADLAKDSNKEDGIAIDVDASGDNNLIADEKKRQHPSPHIVVIIPKEDEEQDDSSSKSPVSSSLTSPLSKQTNKNNDNVEQQQQLQMMLRSRVMNPSGEDDDEWSKMSQCAETEADTWSKVSPSEIDCRSEMSVESGGGGHYGPGIRGGMNFLGRKRSWGRKKATSPSPSSGGKGSRDWWWKQESGGGGGGGEFSIKGYIVDWVSSEARRGRSRTREWPWSSSSTTTTTTTGAAAADEDSPGSKKQKKKKKKQARSGSLEWWAECDDHDSDELMKRIRAEQKRKRKQQQHHQRSVSRDSSREWWRDGGGGGGVGLSGELCNEEFSGEILNNGSTRRDTSKKRSMSEESFTFYHSGELGNAATATTATATSLNNSCELLVTAAAGSAGSGRRRVRTRSREWWSGEMQRGKEWWSGELGSKKANIPPNVGGRFFDWSRESLSGELVGSNRRRERHRRDRSRSRSRDWWSGDLLSRGTTVSSTPSMRGTVCYVAPEYGGGGMMTEKSDVYSFGVLVLVVVSGRRPLQVVASPLSEFERANLISWARHAAQAGRQLDLVDPSLVGAFSKEQATLCISLALLCLQRLPAVRPTMGEVVKILSGEAELPALPFEFSPSPPGGIGPSFKSRRKASSEQVAVDLPLLA